MINVGVIMALEV